MASNQRETSSKLLEQKGTTQKPRQNRAPNQINRIPLPNHLTALTYLSPTE